MLDHVGADTRVLSREELGQRPPEGAGDTDAKCLLLVEGGDILDVAKSPYGQARPMGRQGIVCIPEKSLAAGYGDIRSFRWFPDKTDIPYGCGSTSPD